ncbi:hypothetical protein HAPAU_34350 [Halalkalicoccus paucihalophilus]|uniref:Uncharacterized protein n=1 Tax=Halalkalicoccus paucihalophilus TaxID=1008153 RepID=A0A151AAC7_9EURY|nr:hypothetical protein HAPAU_34350 [Halalkalicoccus paucihalophilus]
MVPPTSFASGNNVMTTLLSAVVLGVGFPILANYALPLVAIFIMILVGMTRSTCVLQALIDCNTLPSASPRRAIDQMYLMSRCVLSLSPLLLS